MQYALALLVCTGTINKQLGKRYENILVVSVVSCSFLLYSFLTIHSLSGDIIIMEVSQDVEGNQGEILEFSNLRLLPQEEILVCQSLNHSNNKSGESKKSAPSPLPTYLIYTLIVWVTDYVVAFPSYNYNTLYFHYNHKYLGESSLRGAYLGHPHSHQPLLQSVLVLTAEVSYVFGFLLQLWVLQGEAVLRWCFEFLSPPKASVYLHLVKWCQALQVSWRL